MIPQCIGEATMFSTYKVGISNCFLVWRRTGDLKKLRATRMQLSRVQCKGRERVRRLEKNIESH